MNVTRYDACAEITIAERRSSSSILISDAGPMRLVGFGGMLKAEALYFCEMEDDDKRNDNYDG